MSAYHYRVKEPVNGEDPVLSIIRQKAIGGLVTENQVAEALVESKIPDNVRKEAKAKFDELEKKGLLVFEAQGLDPR